MKYHRVKIVIYLVVKKRKAVNPMREILFRGKTAKGEWINGDLLQGGYDYETAIWEKETKLVTEVIPESVSEFTGLTDKNGKKVFEGDIIKHYYLDANPDEYDIGRVFWNGATCMYLRTCKSGDGCPQIWDSCEYEIIGNIHDNPELLKGGER